MGGKLPPLPGNVEKSPLSVWGLKIACLADQFDIRLKFNIQKWRKFKIVGTLNVGYNVFVTDTAQQEM